ncbi:MAG: ATP-binding cassette domain-containing protein [Bilifractor sp.]|jgi:putative ABC transport system permease protein
MLQLQHISKEYHTGNLVQKALDDVSLVFRDNEFVAILGPSGSGKTTLLNIIGGLDQYDSGDLVIGGVSTKHYRDRDWDSYRNHTIGFVFQNYNLILHQTVLSNVELALTIGGVSPEERRRRAEDALDQVGLREHMNKRPMQLSGGQMQRVAIARALVNDPDVVLADEPTGALDSETGVQVMNLLKEVAKDRLVIMVTHNPSLAEEYATRIIRIRDGRVISDSDPADVSGVVPETEEKGPGRKKISGKNTRRTSMSFLTALSLSFNNLRTKKARTILVSFAGSIGIIGIALILAISTGVNHYIETTEAETLAQYPLEIESTGVDLTSLMNSSGSGEQGMFGNSREEVETDAVGVSRLAENLFSGVQKNDLGSLKKYLESGESEIGEYTSSIEYIYNIEPQIFRISDEKETDSGEVLQLNPNRLFSKLSEGSSDSSTSSIMSSQMFSYVSSSLFSKLPADRLLYENAYDLKAGHWPESSGDLVLVLPADGRVSDVLLYEIGVMDLSELEDMIDRLSGEKEDSDSEEDSTESVSASSGGDEEQTFSYDEFIGRTFRLVNSADYYQYDSSYGVWVDRSDDEEYLKKLVQNGRELKITGVIQAKDENNQSLQTGIGYLPELVTELNRKAAKSDVVKAQLDSTDVNVLTGDKFGEEQDLDFSKLITIDENAIRDAFSVDSSALEEGLSAEDIEEAGLDADDLNLDDIDLSGIDPGQFVDEDQLESILESIDVSDIMNSVRFNVSADTLSRLFSRMAEGYLSYSAKDPSTNYAELGNSIGEFLNSEEALEVVREQIGEIVSHVSVDPDDLENVITKVLQSWIEYVNNVNEGKAESEKISVYDMNALREYLSTAGGQKLLSDAVSELALDSDGISNEQLAEITGALAEKYSEWAKANNKPQPDKLAESFSSWLSSEDGQTRLTEAAGEIIDTSGVEQALSSQLQSAAQQLSASLSGSIQEAVSGIMSSAMNQISGQLQQTLSSAMKNILSSMQNNMGDLLKIDTDALAGAIRTSMDPEQINSLLSSLYSDASSDQKSVLQEMGYVDPESPDAIYLYSKDFESKQKVTDILDEYNDKMRESGNSDKVIAYTDFMAAMLGSVTRIVNLVSYVLIAFVGISLIVSSIMIGVITYISVLERQKEIGILRAMGASKRNIREVFNAETFITGFLAGLIGVAVSIALTFPITSLIEKKSGQYVRVFLKPESVFLLILLSCALTILAGLIPSGKAAKSDPVAALRTE